ncbi:hypothetical protein [Sphingobacterium tabacisoli]|uniref:Uncharacterized protein n=1 Tax=Sphingobacterium tabacisoli TaxID=2044855 RepID=A0ABW5L4C0_9SPHI|nr:hypothetical protein [Sphingobacterium tabacisoli]
MGYIAVFLGFYKSLVGIDLQGARIEELLKLPDYQMMVPVK